jgi:regulator of RNase E activity RraA
VPRQAPTYWSNVHDQLATDNDSCDVSDALCKLNFRNGGFLSGLTLWSPQRQAGTTKIVGPAYTVQYAPHDDPAPKNPTHYVGSTTHNPLQRLVLLIFGCPD